MEIVKHDPTPFDINKICRTCLRDKGEMRSVFLADESIGQAVVVAEMIMGFTSVQVIFSFVFASVLFICLRRWRGILWGHANEIYLQCSVNARFKGYCVQHFQKSEVTHFFTVC